MFYFFLSFRTPWASTKPQISCSENSSIRSSSTSSNSRKILLQIVRRHGFGDQRRITLASKAFFMVLLALLTIMISPVCGLRCYVCGGATGRECEDIVTRRWSPYVRPRPVLTSDGKRQWEECNDLINNKGCIKQVVNGGKYSAWSFKDYYYGCVLLVIFTGQKNG